MTPSPLSPSTGGRRGRALLLGLGLLALWHLPGCRGGGGITLEPESPPPPAVAGLRCSGPKSTGWCWQAPQPWAPVIDDAVFTDSRSGWAVGDALLRTTDGGATWQAQALPSGAPLRAVRFANASEGWLLARQGGRLWRTQDGGQTWIATAPLPLDNATGLALIGSGSLLVNGLKAGQGGAPFTLLSDDGAATWRTSALFVYPEYAEADGILWGLADGSYAQSVDGGRSFAAPAAWGGSPYFRPVVTGNGSVTAWASVYDPPTGTVGKLALQRLTPGGAWMPVAMPSALAVDWLYDMALFGSGGWALTGSGLTVTTDGPSNVLTLWRREAGAAEWTTAPLPVSARFIGNHGFVDGRTVWLQSVDQAPVLSTDGGRSWVSGFPPSTDATDPLQFVRRDGGGALLVGYGGDGYLAGAERWYRSTDEGHSWRALPGTGPDGDRITGLWMLDSQRGLAATSGGRWLDTANAGRDWTARPQAARLAGTLLDLQFTPGGTGWVVAQVPQPNDLVGGPRPSPMGPLYRSLDQGRSWAELSLPGPAAGRVLGVQFVDDFNGFLRAATGCTSIRFYTCYEQTWVTRDSGTTWRMVGGERAQGALLLMQSATQGVLVGQAGPVGFERTAHITQDGGATWSTGAELPGGGTLVPRRLVSAGTRLWLLSDDFNAGVISGQGMLLSSSDGGRTWAAQALPTPPDVLPAGLGYEAVLNDIAFADPQTGWIVGRQGLVLATTDGGTTWLQQVSGSHQNLLTLRPASAQTAWIGGSAKSILATVSGGR